MTTTAFSPRVGTSWDKAKAYALDELLREAGQTGEKLSLRRVAAKSGNSEEFVRSLRGYNARIEYGREYFTNRETSRVLAVLAALGESLEAFEARVARWDGRIL